MKYLKPIAIELGLNVISPLYVTATLLGLFWVFSWIMLGPIIIPLEIAENNNASFVKMFFMWNAGILAYCAVCIGSFMILEHKGIVTVDGAIGRFCLHIAVLAFAWAVWVDSLPSI